MSQAAKTQVRRCVVSGCQNISKYFPEKIFFLMPKNEERRRSWLLAMGKNVDGYSKRHDVFVCEDHFDVSTIFFI